MVKIQKSDEISLKKLKELDPGAYIIDSWRIGYFNEPAAFMHWSLFSNKPEEKFISTKSHQAKIIAIGTAGCPQNGFKYHQYDHINDKPIGWKEEKEVDISRLKNNDAWIDYDRQVMARRLPDKIMNVMKKNSVITYKH